MNKKFFSALAFSAVMLSSAGHAAETYKLDPNHTNVYWQANHFGFSNPSGKFAKVDGTLVLDEQNPANSKVDVSIDPASIVTGIDKFDAHLRSKDFFNVGEFPAASFTSTKVEVTGKDTAKVYGNLKLLAAEKPVVLDVKLNKIGESIMTKVKTAGFSASTTIKRSDWGMNFGVPGVSDDVKITIEAEANLADSK